MDDFKALSEAVTKGDVKAALEEAQKALEDIPIVMNMHLFEKLLGRVERSAQKALKEQKEASTFLRAYGAERNLTTENVEV